MDFFDLLKMVGGLALFLYGMNLLGDGLSQASGGRLERILEKLTNNPIKAVLMGAVVTGVIQSSAGTVVICVGLVNSGIMTLTQSVGVIMGANIGTTVTGQLIRMADISGESLLLTLIQPKTFAPVVAFVGCIFYVFLRNAKKKNIGQIMLGFGILFTGMSLMDTGVSPLRESAVFQNLFVTMTNPILGVLVGLVVTVIIQSSSASVGILQALSSTGLVTFSSAIPIVLGAHIGTAFTPLLTIGGSSKDGKRAALIHLYFNIIGVTIFLFGFYGLNAVCHFAFVNTTIEAWGIAIVHSVFNILATVILLPFATGLEKLAILTIPDSPEKEEFALLDDRLLNTPAMAVERARAATADMAELARVGVVQAMSLTHKWDDSLAQKVREEEEKVDKYEDALGTYLVKLSSREMSHADSQSVNTLLHTISDFERISDHSVNVLSSAEEIHAKSIEFSKDAQEELQVLEGAVQDVLSRTTDAFRKGDLHLAGKVEPLETVVDELVRAIKARHVARLQTGSCSIEYGFVLEDLLTNYERVCDHCSNVAVAQIEVAQDSFDTHAYLNDLRHGNDTKESEEFHRRLDRYRERYLFPDGQTAEED